MAKKAQTEAPEIVEGGGYNHVALYRSGDTFFVGAASKKAALGLPGLTYEHLGKAEKLPISGGEVIARVIKVKACTIAVAKQITHEVDGLIPE